MNPLVGLQTGWVPQQGLMGNVLQPSQQGLMGSGTIPSLQGVQPGDWSSVAYNMAGRPIQGPSPSVTPPPMPAGVANGTQSSGGSALGGTALGILGALAKNPSLLKSAGSGVSSLWNSLTGGGAAASGAAGASGSGLLGSGATAYGTDAGVSAGVSPLIADDVAATTGLTGAGLAPVGVDAVSELPSVSAAVNAGAAGSGAAAGGLLGAGAAGSGAIGAAGANALAASGGFATGGAAGAGGGSAAAGAGSLGLAALPLAAAAIPFLIGMNGDKANEAGNAAEMQWKNATGATWKPNPAANTNSNGSTFGNYSGFQPTGNGKPAAGTNAGTMYDKNGKAMTSAQVNSAIYNWAVQHGINPGSFHP